MLVQTFRNLRTMEKLGACPSSQGAGFECRCSMYECHLCLRSNRSRARLLEFVHTAQDTRGNLGFVEFVFGSQLHLVNCKVDSLFESTFLALLCLFELVLWHTSPSNTWSNESYFIFLTVKCSKCKEWVTTIYLRPKSPHASIMYYSKIRIGVRIN